MDLQDENIALTKDYDAQTTHGRKHWLRAQAAEADRDRLAGQVDAIRALPDRRACECSRETPVGSEHHAARRGYNEGLADVRAVLSGDTETKEGHE